MKVSLRSLMCTVGMLLAGINVAQAEDIRLAPTFAAFDGPAKQEFVLTSHDCTAENLADGCQQKTGTDPHVGRDFFNCKDRCGGIIAGTETVFLRPYASAGLTDTGAGAQLNFNPSQRYWLGYQSASGLGGRIRYWEFDRGATGAGASALGVEFRNLDAEMTQTVDFRRWNLLFAGGLRYQETHVNSTNVAGVGNISAFDGVGLTFAGQATRDLNSSGSLRLTAGARWSSVYGNSKSAIGAGPLVAAPVRDGLVNVLELNIGPQYRRPLSNGSYLVLGAGLEAQYYSNAVTTDFGNDFGFVGMSSSIGITR